MLDARVATWLDRFVEDVQVATPAPGDAMRIERLPDGRTTLVVRTFQDGRGDVSAIGPRMRATFKETRDVARVIVVRFKPGWSEPVLGVPARALAERFVKLDELWGRAGGELGRELLETRGVPELIARLARACEARSDRIDESSSARLARRAVSVLERENVRVEEVARRLGVTARHLRRAFSESVGIAPKDFMRTVRLHRAVQRAATSSDWGRIAADAGYYDQAHLIGEFRDLVGVTPVAYAKRRAALS